MEKEIFVVHVDLDPSVISDMDSPRGHVKLIPFTGTVEGEIFNGKVLPGGVDVQITNAAGIKHMCAQYMMAGKDNTGADCHVFIQNNGYFERGSNPRPFHTCPTIMTDSEALLPYLTQARFRTEGHPTGTGVDIHVIDTCAE